VCVIASRLYRGEHHPTDVLGSLVFAGLWLTTATLLIQPNTGHPAARTLRRIRNN
jgi:undecaprenyl-diphosphatase